VLEVAAGEATSKAAIRDSNELVCMASLPSVSVS
jgi:hypothetical protein